MNRTPYSHCGFPPEPATYAYKLWCAIELAMQEDKRYVYRDWKEHWMVSDDAPAKGDYWEINGNDVVHVSED